MMRAYHALETAYATQIGDDLARLDPVERDSLEATLEENRMPVGRLRVIWSSRGVPRFVSGWGMKLSVALPEGTPPSAENVAWAFLERFRDLWGFSDPRADLAFVQTGIDRSGSRHVRLAQRYEGLPVFNAEMIVHLTADGRVTGVSGNYVPGISTTATPVISEEEAFTAVERESGATLQRNSAILGILDPSLFGISHDPPLLIWKVRVTEGGSNPSEWAWFVNALDGTIAGKFELTKYENKELVDFATQKNPNHPDVKQVCLESTCCNDNVIPGLPDCSNAGWPEDSLNAWMNLDVTYDYFAANHQCCQENNGQPDCRPVEGWRCWYDNDASDHVRINTRYYKSWTCGAAASPSLGINIGSGKDNHLDSIAHEYTHFLVDLGGTFQASALHEAYSDVFGQFTEMWYWGGTDWKEGTGCGDPQTCDCLLNPSCSCIRNLADPSETYPNDPFDHPDTFNNLDPVSYHANATIPGKAAFLQTWNGCEVHMGVTTCGFLSVWPDGRRKAERIWFDTQEYRLSPTADFTEFREQMLATTEDLYGISTEWSLTNLALNAVGIWSSDVEGCQTFPDGEVSVVKFQVNGETRHYLFYQKAGGNTLAFRYSNHGSDLSYCQYWSAEQSLGSTDEPPSAVVYDGQIWLFFKSPLTNRIKYKTMNASGSWSVTKDILGGRFTDKRPSAAVFDDKIHLFYKGNGNSNLYSSTYDRNLPPAIRWSSEIQVKAAPPTCTVAPTSDLGPAAVSFDNKLWIFYREVAGSNWKSPLRYNTLSAGAVCFSNTTILTDRNGQTVEASGSPAAAVYRGRLHLVNRLVVSLLPPVVAPYYISYGLPNDPDPSARGWSSNVALDAGGRSARWFGGLLDNTTDLILFYTNGSGLFFRSKVSK